MRQLPRIQDPKLLVGADAADDAGVYALDKRRALVQTVDFFTPIVDDPFLYGQIAAANSLSDVYAMGGRPLTALNIAGAPEELSAEMLGAILRGGAVKAREARCLIVGGHTIRNPEPIYGLAVTGLVSPRRMLTNAAARPGDLLVLTKPLGMGIIATGLKRNLTPPALAGKAARIMCGLNKAGPDLAEARLARAAVDVTGFGLLGHLEIMCRCSGVGAELRPAAVPVVGRGVWDLIAKDCVAGGSRQNLRTAEPLTDWGKASPAEKILLADAQTSGGLLISTSERNLGRVLAVLKRHGTPCAAVIGRIVRASEPRMRIV